MSFAERFLRRKPLDQIIGFNGGSLGEQLGEDELRQSPDRMTGVASTQAPTMADKYMSQAQPQSEQPTDFQSRLMRPRSTNPFYEKMVNDPTRQERPREVNPTDNVTKDADYLRQIQDKPLSLRDKLGMVSQNIATTLGGNPLPTRRQRDLERAGGQLQRDLAVQGQQVKQQGLQSQMDAREAATRAAEERIRQGDEKIQQGNTHLAQQRDQDSRNNLIRVYNGQADFDPAAPENAQFVADWEKTFGYKPSPNVRGSQMAVV